MFCFKCGANLPDGSDFCPKCGTKQGANSSVQAVTATETVGQQASAAAAVKPKKKKRKVLIIVGVVLLLLIIIIACSGDGDPNYEATVRAHTPFAISQGLPYTYGEVLDKYITSAEWKTQKDGDTGYVTVSGKAKGTDIDLVIKISAAPHPDDESKAIIKLVSVTINGEESPTKDDATEFMYALFEAYDEGYSDLSDLADYIE